MSQSTVTNMFNILNLLTDDIKAFFNTTLNNDIDELCKSVSDRVFCNDKFINQLNLNTLGLQALRSLLADLCWVDRAKKLDNWHNDDFKKFYRNGLLIKYDLSHDDIIDCMKTCISVKDFIEGGVKREEPRNEIYKTTYNISDNQLDIHSDTFHPTIKVWKHTHEINLNHGPFHFSRNSHLAVDNPARLKFDYDNGIIACSPANKLFSKRKEKKNIIGSFRIASNEGIEIQKEELSKLNFNPVEPIIGPNNMVVFANTKGLHCRGRTKDGVERIYHSYQFRPDAFLVYD